MGRAGGVEPGSIGVPHRHRRPRSRGTYRRAELLEITSHRRRTRAAKREPPTGPHRAVGIGHPDLRCALRSLSRPQAAPLNSGRLLDRGGMFPTRHRQKEQHRPRIEPWERRRATDHRESTNRFLEPVERGIRPRHALRAESRRISLSVCVVPLRVPRRSGPGRLRLEI